MSRRKLLTRIGAALLFSVIGWFVLSFIIVPVVGVLYEIFFSDGTFSGEAILKLIQSKRVLASLKNTYVMALCTIVLVNIIGIFQIMVTEYFDVKGAKLLNLAFMTPLVYGGISLVTGYNFVYSSEGLLTRTLVELFPGMNEYWFTGFTGVLFVHAFSMTGNHILFVKSAFRRIDYSTVEACKSLGGNDLTAFFKVALPVVLPAIFSATILTTLSSLNSFAAPSVLGGKNFYMINSMIQNLNGIGSRDLASLLAFILAISCIILLSVFRRIEKKRNFLSVSKVTTRLRKVKIRNPVLNVLVHGIAYLMVAIYLMPIATVILYSFAEFETIVSREFPKALTLENYIRVFSTDVTVKPFFNSIILSLTAVAMVLVICVISSLAIHKLKNKAVTILEYTLLIPWIIPATMLAVGLISVYSLPSPLVFQQVLLGSFILLPIAYAVTHIPSAMRLMRASLYMIHNSHEEAARSLGASPSYTFFKVVLPVIKPTIVSVGAITFNGLLSEYTVSALLYSASNTPLGIVLRSQESVPNPYNAANTLVYIVVLMVISAITLALTQKYRNMA